MLGVHPNTLRAWTDQGRLSCLRINDRGDRRYRVLDLQAFLEVAGLQPRASAPFQSRLPMTPSTRREVTAVVARPAPRRRPAPARPSPSPVAAAPATMATGTPPTEPPGTSRALAALSELGAQHLVDRDLDATIRAARRLLSDTGCFSMIAIAEWRDGRMVPRIAEGRHRARTWWQRVDRSLAAVCLREGRPIAVSTHASVRAPNGSRERLLDAAVEVYAPIGSGPDAWGVIIVESADGQPLGHRDLDLLAATGSTLALAARASHLQGRVDTQRSQVGTFARISIELSSRLDLPTITAGLLDQAMALFGADRGAVYRAQPDGRFAVAVRRNLSQVYADQAALVSGSALGGMAIASRRAMASVEYATDPRGAAARDAILSEGFVSMAVAPLIADEEILGQLSLYHDTAHPWSGDDLQMLEALAALASVAIRNAGNYERMATWAAQLQSIQQLGTRLDRLTTVTEIGQAICLELRQLIEYHNVRVYRVHGQEVVPVAWRGEIGAYTDEDSEQLRLVVGEGITGWVAQHGVAQYLPDASRDPRSQTIPGTEDDLDESMLLAPMLFEDVVIGVIVLSKLGLDRFFVDDLRYLEIYASIAAQAMINADATEQLKAQSERLQRQLEGRRELLRTTETILSTLDPGEVMGRVIDQVGNLVHADNLGIESYEPDVHMLRPIFARGVHADRFLAREPHEEQGVGGWVARHGTAQYIPDQTVDPRILDPEVGAMVVAPLLTKGRVGGVLTLERLGPDAAFTEDEVDLIQLYAGLVSIALQNALAHQAVEIRAQTDALTSLKNHGTLKDYLSLAVGRGAPFSLLIVDLDDFKSFNDRRGHEAGNALLCDIARALRASCRETDEVFRYGGDEFALILPNTDGQGALQVANKLGRSVRMLPAPGSRKSSGVTCSIGVATFPVDGTDRGSVLLAADRACYVAKRSGRDRTASAAEGLALAGEFLPPSPTPVDTPGQAKVAA